MARDGARIIGGHTMGGVLFSGNAQVSGLWSVPRYAKERTPWVRTRIVYRGWCLGAQGTGGRKHRDLSDITSGLGGLRDIRPQVSPDARRALTLHTR
jgi:hypothetical protein